MQSTSREMLQSAILIPERNINNLRYADDPIFMAESEEELKRFLMKVKEESGKVGLKLNIQKMKIMAPSPNSSVQFSSVTQSCPTLCHPMNRSMPGLPVHHHLPEFTQTPITSWQIDRKTMKTGTDFIFWGFKITANGDCMLEIKRRLLLGRKIMTNLDRILKSRDITLPKIHLVKAMLLLLLLLLFSVVMYECEIWTIKKTEH